MSKHRMWIRPETKESCKVRVAYPEGLEYVKEIFQKASIAIENIQPIPDTPVSSFIVNCNFQQLQKMLVHDENLDVAGLYKGIRITIKPTGDRTKDLELAATLRRDLWAHSPVEIDPDDNRFATKLDDDGNIYFQFYTDYPDEVLRIMNEFNYKGKVALSTFEEDGKSIEDSDAICPNCGVISGEFLPVICSFCNFRNISPCPHCSNEVPQEYYIPQGGKNYSCPECKEEVILQLNPENQLNPTALVEPLVEVRKMEQHVV